MIERKKGKGYHGIDEEEMKEGGSLVVGGGGIPAEAVLEGDELQGEAQPVGKDLAAPGKREDIETEGEGLPLPGDGILGELTGQGVFVLAERGVIPPA